VVGMEFPNFIRRLLGLPARSPPTTGGLPEPSLPRGPFDDEMHGSHHGNQNSADGQGRFGPFPPNSITGFLFGEFASSMEDMMREVEQSMREIDSLFQEPSGFEERQPPFGFRGNFGEFFHHGLPDATGSEDMNELPRILPPNKGRPDENIRHLVLNENEEAAKVDRDLDELLKNSTIPLSSLPEPPKVDKRSVAIIPSERSPMPFRGSSSFETVIATHSFTNGKWEGKSIRETPEGREITTYTRNSKGEIDENTEFIPSSSNPSESYARNSSHDIQSFESFGFTSPFRFFDSFFKPRL